MVVALLFVTNKYFYTKRGKIEKGSPPIKFQAQNIKSVVKSTIPRGQCTMSQANSGQVNFNFKKAPFTPN